MITLRACVVDDEPLARDLLAAYIAKTPYMEMAGSFASAQEAIKTILEDNIDVVFLDIQMPQLNGMEFARIMPPHCRVIFTTAYDRYALDGFKVGALDYLMKPVSYEEFIAAANKALQWVELRRQAQANNDTKDYLMVKSEYKLVQIPVADILFIEGLKDYVKIFTEGATQSIMTLMSMKALERYLPSDRFLRVHRSFIVNTSKIRTVERNRIVFGNHYIPVSDSYRQAFNAYVSSHTLTSLPDDAN